MIKFANSQDPVTNEFNEFLLNYGIWLAVGVAVLLATAVILILVFSQRKKNSLKNASKVYSTKDVYEALGGFDNVLSHQQVGSRIAVTLKDYSKVDDAKLNLLGVDSVIKMSNKITLVVKDDPESFDKLFD